MPLLSFHPFSSTQWVLASISLLAYLGLWVVIYKQRLSSDQNNSSKRLASLSTPVLITHCLLVISIISPGTGLHLGLVNIICLITMLSASMTVFSSIYRPTINLCLFAFPIAALSLILVMIFPSKSVPITHLGNDELTHISLSILAFSVLSISAGQAIFIGLMDYQLRHHLLKSWHNTFPPLQTLEHSLFEMISLGLILLSLSILSGLLFLDNVFAQHVAHKMFFSIVSWLVFSALLIGRIKFGWRGTRAIQFSLAGYALLSLAFLGSKFVLEILLERA